MNEQDDRAMLIVVGLGVIGGLFMGNIIRREVFQEGLTDKERKSVFMLAGGLIGAYGLSKLLDLDERWVDANKLLEKPPIDEALQMLPK